MSCKKKLWTPLSSLVRRTLLSSTTDPNFSFNPIPKFQSRTLSCPPDFQNGRPIVPLPGFDFPGNIGCHRRRHFNAVAAVAVSQCWNCNASAEATPFLHCSSCRCIQPVDHSIDYFQIFGLEKKYDSVEEERLEGKYKDWQKKLHPDLVHSKSEREREYAAQQSARVIDAYRTLRKPLARAIYILKLEGIGIDEEETLSDIDLLTEIMEIREAVEEAPDTRALNQIQCQMQEKLKEWSNSFANAFQSRNFAEAVNAIRRMKYYERANEEIVKRQ